jgi:hypothetical protein
MSETTNGQKCPENGLACDYGCGDGHCVRLKGVSAPLLNRRTDRGALADDIEGALINSEGKDFLMDAGFAREVIGALRAGQADRLPSESGERFLGEGNYQDRIAQLEALLQDVWNTIPASYDGLDAKEFARVLNRIPATLSEPAKGQADEQGEEAPTMPLLPNEYHPGPRCSCRECLTKYPGVLNTQPEEAPSETTNLAREVLRLRAELHIERLENMRHNRENTAMHERMGEEAPSDGGERFRNASVMERADAFEWLRVVALSDAKESFHAAVAMDCIRRGTQPGPENESASRLQYVALPANEAGEAYEGQLEDKEDAARYRWLRANCQYGFEDHDEPQLIHRNGETGPHQNADWREDLDAAVDKLMLAAAPEAK